MFGRRSAAFAVAIVLAVALGACSADDPGTVTAPGDIPIEPATPGRGVLVIGDSNVFESTAVIEAALRACGREPTVRGVPGYGVMNNDDYWLPELPGLLASDPSVIVVALGTNDAGADYDEATFDDRLDQLMRALPDDVPVIWVTHVDDRLDAFGPNAAKVNERIRAATERWDRLGVLDFTPALTADPALLRDDALHFTEKGMKEYARRIALSATAAVENEGVNGCRFAESG